MGKKRKLQDQRPAFEEDRGPAAYTLPENAPDGAVNRSDGSGSRCDPELVAYLTEVSQHAAAVTDPEERQLLVANVLEEIQGKELRIASDAVTSRLLEALLTGVPGSQLMQFLQAFANEDMLFSLAGSAFGSHVAENILARLHQQANHLLEDAEQAGALEELLSGMVGSVGGHLYDYIMDKHATHVARGLLVIIAGRDVLSPVAKKQQQQQQQMYPEEQQQQDEGATAASAVAASRQQGFKAAKSSLQEKLEGVANTSHDVQPLRFPALLRRYAKMLPLYEASSMMLLGKNSYSGPFVQAVLRAAAGDEDLLQLLLPPILGVDATKAAAADPGQSLSTLTDSHVGRLLRDECYSHLLEVVVAVLPQGLRAEFYVRFLKGRLLPLATHHSANFVVQAWLAASSTPQQVQDVLAELQHHLPDLLKRRRSGVAAALVAAAGRAGDAAQQAATVDALSTALTALPQWQGREGSDHLAPALLTLDTSACLSSSTSQQQQQQSGYGSSSRLSTPGSAMLAMLLTLYNKKAAKPFAASVAALSAADAARAARDSAGSRALQAFIEGGVAGSTAKAGLLDKLAGSWGDVALQGAGSFFLEKAYAWADLRQKEAIVAELLTRQTRLLSGCPWGPLLVRKLGLEAYARSPEEWRKRAASLSTAKKAFEQLLEADAQPSVGVAAAGGGRKRKQQQQQHEALQRTDAQHAAAGGSSSSKKDKKRATSGLQASEQDTRAEACAVTAPDEHQPVAALGKKKHKKKKSAEGAEDTELTADGVAGAVVAAKGAQNKLGADKKKKKKKKSKPTDTVAGVAQHAVGTAAAAAAIPAAGTTSDFVSLLGFGGLAAEQHHISKKRKKAKHN